MFDKLAYIATVKRDMESGVKARRELYKKCVGLAPVFEVWANQIEPLLPPGWEFRASWLGDIDVTNFGSERRDIPFEEFRLVIKIVEQATGAKLSVKPSFSSDGLSYISANGNVEVMNRWPYVNITFSHGDCKVECREEVVKVFSIDEKCLRLGKEEAAT